MLLVTEPTPFGLHDLKLAVEMVEALGLPMGVVINRAGFDGADVQAYCRSRGVDVLLEIPQDRRLAEAYSRGVMACDAVADYEVVFSQLLQAVSTRLLDAAAETTTEAR